MAKTAALKQRGAVSIHSRAAKRASSPSIDTDKSLKEAKPPTPAILAVHAGAGISKKSKQGRKANLSAKAKRRQESAMDRAEAVMDKKEIKVAKSKDRARTIQGRSKAWEDLNRKMLAKKEMEAALALELELEQQEWIDEDEDEEFVDEKIEEILKIEVGEIKISAGPNAPALSNQIKINSKPMQEEEEL